jgi:cyclopropane-fatty-acyl-phospholipid synthase
MTRGYFERLGVGADRSHGESRGSPRSKRAPNGLDRWIATQLSGRLDRSRVRLALWDEPGIVDAAEGSAAVVRIVDRKALRQLIQNPILNFGDLYSAGRITVHGDLMQVIDEAYRFAEKNPMPGWFRRSTRPASPGPADSRRNIHHHYDIGNDFYALWLDSEALQYTCAYFAEPTMTIEQAQQAKMHHVCRKIRLKPGERVVEAGGGWGGFALFMAKHYGAKVRSFNISSEQINYSREWASRENLDSQVEFVEDDYRNISGEYDAFLSIGMLEHVGTGNYEELGRLINRVLASEGRGLVHTIGRDRPQPLNPWIDRRIFPGAYPPTLREMMDLFEPNGLSVLDIENIRLHYAETLRAWLERFEQNADTVRSMFDDAFVRAWRLYLVGSIAAFVHGKLQLFQVSFARSGENEIPWTRAHLYRR